MNKSKIKWECRHFSELSNVQLYSILKLRQKVFVVEQNCPYLDTDDLDLKSYHLLGMDLENGLLLAYSRILPPSLKYQEASIGRVVTDPQARRTGLGKELMRVTIENLEQLFGKVSIRIGAQKYLVKFYEEFGFVSEGEFYLEDNIEHIEMVRKEK